MNNLLKPGILFRKMKIEDIDGIVAVENRSFTVPWSKKMFLDELANPLTTYYVAVQDEVIVAYAGLWIIGDEAHITNIAVDPCYRGCRIASGLMDIILALAAEKRLCGITLEVRAGNIAAISLYKKFGFEVEGRRKGYYSDNQEDALIMWFYP